MSGIPAFEKRAGPHLLHKLIIIPMASLDFLIQTQVYHYQLRQLHAKVSRLYGIQAGQTI